MSAQADWFSPIGSIHVADVSPGGCLVTKQEALSVLRLEWLVVSLRVTFTAAFFLFLRHRLSGPLLICRIGVVSLAGRRVEWYLVLFWCVVPFDIWFPPSLEIRI